MLQKKVKKRASLLAALLLVSILAIFFILQTLNKNILYFKSPTDFKNELMISYSGTVPNLFSEEKGVVAEGKLQDKSFFIADRILAKHDENYMPPELQSIMNNNDK